MTDSTQDEREALIGELRSLGQKMRSAGMHAKQFMDLDLTFPQLKTVMVLAESESMSMSPLAQALGITLPACTHLVDKLVQAGFVARNEDPADRRVVRCSLTDKGRTVVERLSASPFEHPQVLNRLGIDDLRVMVHALSICQRVMGELQAQPSETGSSHDSFC